MSVSYFFVTCPRGVEDLLAEECISAGIESPVQSTGGVSFRSELEHAYRLCLWSRLASRVLLRLSEFSAQHYDELYEAVQQIDWSQHMSADGCFAIDCFSAHETINNSHFATLRIKDAVVDQFMQNTGKRPDIERETPDIRINVYLGKSLPGKHNAALYLDMAGQPLHIRGYRQHGGEAPLKENLAAAILYRCKWPALCDQNTPLFDPMCGSASLLIEAAYMAIRRAPGILRHYFGFNGWKQHQPELWQSICEQARTGEKPLDSLPAFIGCDVSASALTAAKTNVRAAGFDQHIQLHRMDSLEQLPVLPDKMGLVLCNPPYGKRLGDARQLKLLYYGLGRMLKQHFAGWQAAIFTADEVLAKTVGLRAHHTNTLYNGALRCVLYQYHLRDATRIAEAPRPDVQSTVRENPLGENARAFENRLRKNLKHLSKWARRQNISCYRLYDADLPQYAMAIDIYARQVHVQEYEAPSEIDSHKAMARLHEAVSIIADVLDVPEKLVIIKTRKKQSGSEQYLRQDESGRTRIVEEYGLKYIVNLHDYLDTGLFLDHRLTRQLITRLAAGKQFLNLFAYTGSASVCAAAGGAAGTTTVDMSNTYLEWAQDNMALNHFTGRQHVFERADCLQWLWDAWKARRKYSLIFLDPPTFSNSKKMQQTFDVSRDQVQLIQHAMRILGDDGQLIFSTNARRFKLDEDALADFRIEDLTARTTDEDYRRKPAHKCWSITRKAVTFNWADILNQGTRIT